jgi:TRAP-type C4-dicarboxylate transport system permease small subunit
MSARFALRLERVIRRFLEGTLVLVLASMAAICFLEVVLRYGLGSSFGWYDEFTGYLLVWLTFLAAVTAQQEQRHIGVGDLAGRFGPGWRRAAALTTLALMILLHVLLVYYGGRLALRFLTDRAITLPVPMGIIYAVIPLSAALMLVVLLIQLGQLLRSESER